ncbi:MAG: M67 family metallopeptidase [Leptolyngbyaceae cyanobacterium CSU_1_4]|nr:M67 family metallopeptidase [Leptolyngbyaceae cyanobacterium CSU_1_4]
MVVQFLNSQVQQIIIHAVRTYPQECCGLLLGHLSPDRSCKQVIKIWETVNAWNPEVGADLTTIIPQLGQGKRDRFWIDPQDLLAAQRDARDHQMNIVGIYHSHPDHPAVPSESDRLLAWSEYSYLILSVRSGIVSDYRCWALDHHQQFQPEEMRAQ